MGLFNARRKRSRTPVPVAPVDEIPDYLAPRILRWMAGAEGILCLRYDGFHSYEGDRETRKRMIWKFDSEQRRRLSYDSVENTATYLADNFDELQRVLPYLEFLLRDIQDGITHEHDFITP